MKSIRPPSQKFKDPGIEYFQNLLLNFSYLDSIQDGEEAEYRLHLQEVQKPKELRHNFRPSGARSVSKPETESKIDMMKTPPRVTVL